MKHNLNCYDCVIFVKMYLHCSGEIASIIKQLKCVIFVTLNCELNHYILLPQMFHSLKYLWHFAKVGYICDRLNVYSHPNKEVWTRF